MDHATAPPLTGVLETVLYYTDPTRTESFYGELLGFRLLSREPGRSLFYRAGSSVFLLFDAAATRRPGGRLPPHGAVGPGHACFRVPRAAYTAWKAHLTRRGVPILHEERWGDGQSFYFEDPSGNLLEIADRDFWPP